MKFKPGDRVICIDNTKTEYNLILNKQYIIKGVINVNLNKFDKVRIYNENVENVDTFYAHRFILDKQYYRKEKLNILKNGI